MNARREVEKAGGKPVLIESGLYGTTCARVGCMPSKLLIAAADPAESVRTADRFGIHPGQDWQIDGTAVLERVRRERDRFVAGTVKVIEALPDEQRLQGRARFVGPTTLDVDGHTHVEARAVVIATGSEPVIPPPFDAVREHVMTSDDVFEIPDLPESIAVIGTGIIGLELGQALHRLGVDVMLFTPFDELGPFTDPSIQALAHEIFGAELKLQLRSKMLSATAVPDGMQLHWTDSDGNEHRQIFERVLVAAGRRPRLKGLGLENTGLELDARGQPVWDPHTTQAGIAPIFVAGDASGHIALLHEASDEGHIAGANAMSYPEVTAHVRRTPLAIAFTDPQMALIGQHYSELDLDEVEIGTASFENQGRARVIGRNRGLLRVYGKRHCCTLVGAEIFGPEAEHLAHLLAWAVQQRLSVPQALEMPVYHPVLEEGLRTALRRLAKKLRVTGQCRCEDMAIAPGI